MDFFTEKYKNTKGKTDSMYIYILYECSQEKIKDHVKKQTEVLDRVNDLHKKRLFMSRYHLLRNMIEQNEDDYVYNDIIFLGDELNSHNLTKSNRDMLKKFNHQNISFVYDDHFKLDYLDDLLFNNNYCHVYKVNNNKIDYIHITRTKKIVVSSKESKPLDIKGFIDSTLSPNNKYIIHGVSNKLKDLKDSRAYTIINRLIKDDELMNMVEKIDQENMLLALCDDLLMLNDSKHMHKVLFKKEIPNKIKNSQVQKLYIDSKLSNKFLANMKKNGLDINFKIITIDSSIKSFIEGRERTLYQYDGVVGIAYY
jgi:hypothetical protein